MVSSSGPSDEPDGPDCQRAGRNPGSRPGLQHRALASWVLAPGRGYACRAGALEATGSPRPPLAPSSASWHDHDAGDRSPGRHIRLELRPGPQWPHDASLLAPWSPHGRYRIIRRSLKHPFEFKLAGSHSGSRNRSTDCNSQVGTEQRLATGGGPDFAPARGREGRAFWVHP